MIQVFIKRIEDLFDNLISNKMKSTSIRIILSFSSLLIGYNSFCQDVIKRPIGVCKMVFQDNFDGEKLNLNKWDYRTDSKHWSKQLPENVSVKDGLLYLAVKKQKADTMNYTGSGIISKKAFRYGYYESRFKIPTGKGWHTSFWMMFHDGSGSTLTKGACQELDVCENDSKQPFGFSNNVHDWNGKHTAVGAKEIETPDLSKDFHVWGCDFSATEVKFYFEGKLVRTVDVRNQELKDVHIWLTTIATWLGKTDAVDETKLPSAAVFDYVRFYELQSL